MNTPDPTAWNASLAFVWRPDFDGVDNDSAPGEKFLSKMRPNKTISPCN